MNAKLILLNLIIFISGCSGFETHHIDPEFIAYVADYQRISLEEGKAAYRTTIEFRDPSEFKTSQQGTQAGVTKVTYDYNLREYQAIIIINPSIWASLSLEGKRELIYHELFHAQYLAKHTVGGLMNPYLQCGSGRICPEGFVDSMLRDALRGRK